MTLLDQVQKLVNSAKYLELVSILEEKIAYHPEELNYRWFMGLAYLLQEDQETAIKTWLVPFLTNETNDVEQLTVELIEFLEEQVKEAIKNEQLGQAKVIYDAIFLINSEYNHPQLREQLLPALTVIANGLEKSEHYDLAVDVFNEILDLEPQQDSILRSIACCYCQIEYLDQAKESINRAIEINPESPENHYILGMIFEKQAKINEAIIAYKLSIQQNNSYLNAYVNLINLLKKQNKIDEAITLCESGLSLIPSSSTLHNLLGDCYQSVGQIKKSHLHLGYAAYKSINSRDFAVALHHFEKYFSESNQERIQEFSFYDTLANCYRMCNQTESAIEVLEKTLKFYPIKKLEINRLNQVLLPILYNNQKEIDFYRHRFSQLLNSLINNTKLITQDHIDDAIQSIYIRTNFWLSYQNRNDLYIQKKYGDYITNIIEEVYFHHKYIPRLIDFQPELQTKIRVGIISYRLRGLGLLYSGWIKYLDKQQFEIYVYHLIDQNNNEESHSRDFFAHHSDIYRTISLNIGWQRIGEQVRDDQIDVMIFPELGLDPIFNLLTTYRLAPIQCTTWAHPVTSGIPAIDYFISSELMEPENGDEHYSETLIRLPNLAFALPPLDTSDINGTRSDFNLEENVIIYWCCQSLFKYLPQHDYIFARIVQNNINFRLIFVAPPQGKVITDDFAKRLEKTFTKYGLNYQDYCIFLPRLNNQDFIKINLLADVFLDGLSWSGGLTTRQAIACNLPVVTCPGEFMRSRHSYAYLKMIGVTETIASNEEDYIQIAVRLGQDADWRQTIRNKTMDNKHRLFDDQECVLGLEHFLKQAVQDYNLKLNHGI